jgi:heme exporter protein D
VNWGSLENFLHMGGYGFYVWGAYGVTVVALALEMWSLHARRRRAMQEAARTARAAKGSSS